MSSELPISTLKQIVWGDDGFDLDKSGNVDDMPDPIKKLWEQAPVAAALANADRSVAISTDWLHMDESDVDEESFQLDKTPVILKHEGPQPRTFAKTRAEKLGVVKTEKVVTENGDVWIHAFNSGNELVDARLLLPEVE